jgi:hypothetical protein
MPIDVGGSSPGDDGKKVFGLPLPVVLIGGGVAILAFLMLRGKGGMGGSGDVATGDAVYGAALGPNASLALGDLTHQLMTQSGLLQDQMSGYHDSLETILGSQAEQLTGIGSNVTGIGANVRRSWADMLYLEALQGNPDPESAYEWFRTKATGYGLGEYPSWASMHQSSAAA